MDSILLLIFIVVVILAIFAIAHISGRGAGLLAAATEIGVAVASGGGTNYPTIHISGASGAGKTTLGERIKAAFPAAHVYDVDDITAPIAQEVMAKRRSEQYAQSHYIARVEAVARKLIADKRTSAPVILVGFMDWGNAYRTSTPKVAFDYRFFIDVSIEDLLEQRWKRDIGERVCGRICNLKLDLATKPIVDVLYDPALITAHNATMRKQYRHLHYKFMKADAIFAEISRILKK